MNKKFLEYFTIRRLLGLGFIAAIFIVGTISRQNIEELAKQEGWDTILAGLWRESSSKEFHLDESSPSLVPVLLISFFTGGATIFWLLEIIQPFRKLVRWILRKIAIAFHWLVREKHSIEDVREKQQLQEALRLALSVGDWIGEILGQAAYQLSEEQRHKKMNVKYSVAESDARIREQLSLWYKRFDGMRDLQVIIMVHAPRLESLCENLFLAQINFGKVISADWIRAMSEGGGFNNEEVLSTVMTPRNALVKALRETLDKDNFTP